MKKRFPLHPALALLLVSFVFLTSCKKVNEATLLGGGLVPQADNITSFETTFAAQTDNRLLNDTTKLGYNEGVAVGSITNDPEFGTTIASAYFQLIPASYGISPFAATSPIIDSVVLSLDYLGGYGDTTALQTVHVFEIAQSTSFNDTTYYDFNGPGFATTGSELGSRTFSMSSLKDSITLQRPNPVKVANQLRIKLDNAFGQRLAGYDSATAYRNDTVFKNVFRGLALKADAGSGNGLAYFLLASTNTNLTFYYKGTLNGKADTTETVFTHALRNISNRKGGQANKIQRQPSGGYATYLANGNPLDDKLFIQSTPVGSVAYLKIPALDTFHNKLIHRAELIATRLPSTFDNILTPPRQLFVDRINTRGDSAFAFPEFVTSSTSTGVLTYTFTNFPAFGGSLRTDQTYRFDITKFVQDVLVGKTPNDTLRLYAPFLSLPYNPATNPAQQVLVQAIPTPAYGRVVLAGGNAADTNTRLRLRIIYSNL